MEGNKLNEMLSAYYSKQAEGRREVPEKSANCPPIETLGKYVSGTLESAELYNISSHIKSCKFCNEVVEGALLYSAYEKQINLGTVSGKIKEKAKSLNPFYKTRRRKIMDYLKRNSYLMLSLASLVASFFVSRYFMQFLILATILGLKWVFNKESTRTLVMIYNAWKKRDEKSERELEEIFKNRLF